MTLRELGKRAFLVFCICAFAFFVFVFVCCENICNGDQSDQVAGDRRMTLRRRRGVLASLPSPYPVTCTYFRTLQLCFCVLCICIFVFVLYLYLCLTICILCLSPFWHPITCTRAGCTLIWCILCLYLYLCLGICVVLCILCFSFLWMYLFSTCTDFRYLRYLAQLVDTYGYLGLNVRIELICPDEYWHVMCRVLYINVYCRVVLL